MLAKKKKKKKVRVKAQARARWKHFLSQPCKPHPSLLFPFQFAGSSCAYCSSDSRNHSDPPRLFSWCLNFLCMAFLLAAKGIFFHSRDILYRGKWRESLVPGNTKGQVARKPKISRIFFFFQKHSGIFSVRKVQFSSSPPKFRKTQNSHH